jgi:hypothetical protein
MTRKHMKKGGSSLPPNCYYNQNKKKGLLHQQQQTRKKGGVKLPLGVVVTKRHKKGAELHFPRFLLCPKEMQRKGRAVLPSVAATQRNREKMVIVMMRTHTRKNDAKIVCIKNH